MSAESRRGDSLSGIAFAFFASLGLLAALATGIGYAIAAARSGGLGTLRYAPWIATISLALATVVAYRIENGDRARASVAAQTAGAAAAGGLMFVGSFITDVRDLGRVGPVQLTIATVSMAFVILSPVAGRAITRYGLVRRFARLVNSDESDTAAGKPAIGVPRSWEVAAAVVGLVVLAASLAYIMSSGPLGHDESVYAVKARSWYAGTPPTGFGIYRPPGLAVIGWVVLHFSDSEVAFRSAGIALAVGTVIVMWIAGRTMLSPAAAWMGSGVFVASASYLRRATEFLNDLTAAALLLAVMLLIWYHFERRPDGWWIVAAAPLGAAAYYVRYGSAPGLVIIAIVAGAVWFTRLRRSSTQIAVTAAAMVALLIPHFVYSLSETGSLLGVFGSARTSVGGGRGGLADYVDWFPKELAGHLGAALMVAAFIYATVLVVRSLHSRMWQHATRTAVFLTGTALLITIVLGAFTHGEPRFVFLPIMTLLLVGGQAIVALVVLLSTVPRRITAVLIGLVIVGAFLPGPSDIRRTTTFITAQFDVVVDAADTVRSDAGSDTCSIRSSYVPQLTWYSSCATFNFSDDMPTDGSPAYLVLFAQGKRQPDGTALDAELARTPGSPFAMVIDRHDRIGSAFIYEYAAGGG